ncbi:hypothetical protein BH11PLA2_BH11PLA2_15310 [soil metagenome]
MMASYHDSMTDEFLALLRCPLDPKRESPLTRDDQTLVCKCAVRFPIKQGLPILIADQAEMPGHCLVRDSLPCRKSRKK